LAMKLAMRFSLKSSVRPALAAIPIACLAAVCGGCSAGIAVRVVEATRARVESTVTTTSSGTVEAEQEAVLSFGLAGRVSSIAVAAGDQVHQGQVLAEIENRDLKTILNEAN